MTFAKLILAAALTVSSVVPAAAANKAGSGPSAQSAPSASNSGEKKICKKLPVTGTRMEKTACLTKSQWAKVEQDQ